MTNSGILADPPTNRESNDDYFRTLLGLFSVVHRLGRLGNLLWRKVSYLPDIIFTAAGTMPAARAEGHDMNTRCLIIVAALAAATASVAGPMADASAAVIKGPEVATASSSAVWDTNRACLVVPNGMMQCFTTLAKMRARSAQLASSGVGTSYCPVTLFAGVNYTGQALEVTGQGYWINLSDYGFDNVAVSFAGTGCGFHLAQGTYGAGYWYPGNTGPWSSSPDMGPGWDDVVSSVYIY